MLHLVFLTPLALLLSLTACDGGEGGDSGAINDDSGASSDTGATDDTDDTSDTSDTTGGGELRLVLGYINQDIDAVTITLDGTAIETGLEDATSATEGYYFHPGRTDAGIAVSAGSHELVWEFAYQQPQCGNPPDCTEVEFVAMTTGDTLTFDVAEGDEVLAVAFLNFEFTGQEFIAVPTQHAEVLTAPQPDNRGLFLVHGGSNGQNGPVDVRVYGSLDGQTQEYVQGQAPLGGTGTSMLSVPYGSIDQLGIARSGGDSYTMYNHPTIADGDVRYAVFRSSNNAPWVPLESGSGGQQLSGF